MTECRHARQIERDGMTDQLADLERRHLAHCEECHAAITKREAFEADLAVAGRKVSGPPLPASVLAAARQMPREGMVVPRFLTLTAVATASVLVLAVLTGTAMAWLIDRQPSTVGPPTASMQPEPTSPYRHSRQEFLLLVGQCVRDEGFDSVRVDVRESKIDFTDRNDVRLGGPEAVRTCIVRVDPARHEPPPPRSERQLVALYNFMVAQARCLEALGHRVDTPPSLEAFLAEGATWEPHSGTSAPVDDRTGCAYIPERPAFLDW